MGNSLAILVGCIIIAFFGYKKLSESFIDWAPGIRGILLRTPSEMLGGRSSFIYFYFYYALMLFALYFMLIFSESLVRIILFIWNSSGNEKFDNNLFGSSEWPLINSLCIVGLSQYFPIAREIETFLRKAAQSAAGIPNNIINVINCVKKYDFKTARSKNIYVKRINDSVEFLEKYFNSIDYDEESAARIVWAYERIRLLYLWTFGHVGTSAFSTLTLGRFTFLQQDLEPRLLQYFQNIKEAQSSSNEGSLSDYGINERWNNIDREGQILCDNMIAIFSLYVNNEKNPSISTRDTLFKDILDNIKLNKINNKFESPLAYVLMSSIICGLIYMLFNGVHDYIYNKGYNLCKGAEFYDFLPKNEGFVETVLLHSSGGFLSFFSLFLSFGGAVVVSTIIRESLLADENWSFYDRFSIPSLQYILVFIFGLIISFLLLTAFALVYNYLLLNVFPIGCLKESANGIDRFSAWLSDGARAQLLSNFLSSIPASIYGVFTLIWLDRKEQNKIQINNSIVHTFVSAFFVAGFVLFAIGIADIFGGSAFYAKYSEILTMFSMSLLTSFIILTAYRRSNLKNG